MYLPTDLSIYLLTCVPIYPSIYRPIYPSTSLPICLVAYLPTCLPTYLRLFPSSRWQVVFPLGELTKPQVRKLAEVAGLPVAQKRESMGVCFVGKRRSWRGFLSQYVTPRPGM